MENEKRARELSQEEKDRMQRCTEELRGVLSKYNCVLDASMLVTSQGAEPRIIVVPLKEDKETMEVPSFEE